MIISKKYILIFTQYCFFSEVIDPLLQAILSSKKLQIIMVSTSDLTAKRKTATTTAIYPKR